MKQEEQARAKQHTQKMENVKRKREKERKEIQMEKEMIDVQVQKFAG